MQLPRNSTAHIVPTYIFRQGKTNYLHNGIHYETKIADNDLLIDEKHQLYFYTSIEWIQFLQKTYPSPHQIYLPLTVHEISKINDEHDKMEKDMHSAICESPRKRHVNCIVFKIK